MRHAELTPTAVAAGGDAIAREPDGRVVFVEGALPGERVRAAVTEQKRDFWRAVVVEVLDPSPDRLAEPLCGCSGCTWGFVAPDAQVRLKAAIVRDGLRRIAHLDDAPVRIGGRIEPLGYRTTARMAVAPDGRAGFHARHDRRTVDTTPCSALHPLLADLAERGRFRGAEEVLLRVGVSSGDRLVVPRPEQVRVEVPDGVRKGRRAYINEDVRGRTWRVSAPSFFQSGPAAAELLVATVRDAAADHLGAGDVVVDAYAGVGLLGGSLVAGTRARLMALESQRAAVADARANLADLDAIVIAREVATWQARDDAALVLADPARPGLGRSAVTALAAAGAPRLVLVSCDPASLARDVKLLDEVGYRLVDVAVLDLFPNTFHVEAVSTFEERR